MDLTGKYVEGELTPEQERVLIRQGHAGFNRPQPGACPAEGFDLDHSKSITAPPSIFIEGPK